VAGLEKKSRVLNARERRTVACHEMGHALVAMCLPGTDPVQKVSIIPRGVGTLGYTIQRPTEDRFLLSRGEIRAKLTVLLAGRAAEMLVLGEPSTGAADDLAKATEIARALVLRFGMDETLGLVSWEPERRSFLGGEAPMASVGRFYSEATAERIDAAVSATVSQAFVEASRLLAARREVLEKGIARLLATETLSGEALGEIRRELLPAGEG
jgi:cell division protease FtsH